VTAFQKFKHRLVFQDIPDYSAISPLLHLSHNCQILERETDTFPPSFYFLVLP
jgi:hypothetical protein